MHDLVDMVALREGGWGVGAGGGGGGGWGGGVRGGGEGREGVTSISTKSIWMAQFFWIPMWKAPFFWHPGICTYFLLRFFEAAYPLGITWIDCDNCLTTSKKWVQKIKGQYMNRSIFWMITYMNGSIFSKTRYMNVVGFEILARTPIPKLTLSYHPHSIPPPPPPHPQAWLQSHFLQVQWNNIDFHPSTK